MAKQTANFRLAPDTEAALDWLAQSCGNRTAALEEAVQQWHRAIVAAAADNAALFDRAEWNMLADACNGIGLIPEMVPPHAGQYLWGPHIAMELADAQRLNSLGSKWFPETWSRKRVEGRVAEMVAQLQLLDAIHGHALMDVLRLFWTPAGVDHIDHSADEWWAPAFRGELARRSAV